MKPAEAYILNQEEPYRTILLHLQMLIEKTIPDAQLLFKWKVPFYYVDKRPICYTHRPVGKGFIDVGFWNAAHLTINQEHMTKDGRKMMKSLRYESLDDIDYDILIAILKDAYEIRDNKFWK